jgi:eukaryotic-like serine/threonine-protein kinase
MTDSGSSDDGELEQAKGQGSSLSTDATLLREGSSLPPAGHDPLLGEVVAGRYRVEALIGQGGMGRVYRAVHVHMHKIVALKVLRPEMTVVRGVLARFEREAVAAGRISHPNVAAATDFGRIGTNGPFYLVLEYVAGKNLRREIKGGPFSVQRALAVATQACEGLVAAHQQGIIHRDLKPDNIMLVDDNGRDLVKVLDFGIAKVTDAEAGEHQTRYGVVMGTPRYMSPEQAAGGTVDHRTDLYALGVILYEMLTGQAPFVASGLNAVLSQQLVNDPPPLPNHVPRELAKLCLKLLARDAEGRPESAAAVLEMLRAVRLDPLDKQARFNAGVVPHLA